MGQPRKKTSLGMNSAAQTSSHSSKTKKAGISLKKVQSDCHQNQIPNVVQVRAQTLSICVDGPQNNLFEGLGTEEQNLVKKSDYNRKRKDRHKSQGDVFGADFYARNTKAANEHCAWFISDLYDDFNIEMNDDEDFAFLENDFDDDHAESTKEDILSWATSILSLSPTARCLVKEAAKNGWQLSLEDLGGPDFHLDVPEKRIVLDNAELSEYALARSNYFSSILVISLVRALRDVWQEKRNGAFDEDYAPESILSLERIRAADLDVIAVMVAWELRCEGYNNLWRHILGSDDSDLAMRFSGFLERDPSSTFTNKALAATFTQWFRNEDRVQACDHETLDYMDEILASSEMQNPFGKGSVQKIDIERLSCLPDKTAYLQYDASSIISDPLYAGMNDEINQSHLMHIMYDINVTMVQGVPFRNFDLADRIFPNGLMTPDQHETIH